MGKILRVGCHLKGRLRQAVTLLLAMALILPAQAEPKPAALSLVASIRPLALLAQELLQGSERVRVQTLLPAAVSPHAYALRVSDMRRLQAADLVVWVGPELERFLAKPLSRSGKAQLRLTALSGLHWPETPENSDKSGLKFFN